MALQPNAHTAERPDASVRLRQSLVGVILIQSSLKDSEQPVRGSFHDAVR
jgi:hypothetical protein